MKWILLITSLFFIQIRAQNISLHIIENAVNISNDSLYFKFKIENDCLFIGNDVGFF